MNKTILNEIKELSFLGKIAFPEVVKRLIENDIERYIVDLVMPKMDGIAVLTHLHADDWGNKAKIIILSNLSDNEKIAEAMTLGSHDYLIKSDWKLEELLSKVKERLE